MAKVEWSEVEPGAVEQLTGILLSRENPSAIRIRPSRGDGGIDVLVPEPGRPQLVDVYQVKAFHENLTGGQKRQIKRSYERLIEFAQANALTVKAWYLTLPLQPTNENRQWLREFTEDSDFPCEWRGRDYLDGLAAAYPEVVDYYLRDGKQQLDRAIVALTDVLRMEQRLAGTSQQPAAADPPFGRLQPGEVAGSLQALHATLNRHDPHYRYDFSVDHDRPQVPDVPFLVAAVQHHDGDRWVTFKIFARFREALAERPVPGNLEIRVEPGSDLQRDLDLFHRYGRPFDIPGGAATVVMDLPGGLGGGPFPVERMLIGPTASNSPDRELRLSILDSVGSVLADTLVLMEPATAGLSGQGYRVFGVEANRAFTMEMLIDPEPGTVGITFDIGDIAGQRPALLVEGFRFLAHFRRPNRLQMRPAYGPSQAAPADISVTDENRLVSELLEVAEALATIQEHTTARIGMPDPDAFDVAQAAEVKDVATLLRGGTLTPTWTKVGPVHVKPGVEPNLHEIWTLAMDELLKIDLDGNEIPLGVRRLHLPVARVDPGSVEDHEDHKDVRFIPATDDARAVISLVGPAQTPSDGPDEAD